MCYQQESLTLFLWVVKRCRLVSATSDTRVGVLTSLNISNNPFLNRLQMLHTINFCKLLAQSTAAQTHLFPFLPDSLPYLCLALFFATLYRALHHFFKLATTSTSCYYIRSLEALHGPACGVWTSLRNSGSLFTNHCSSCGTKLLL